MAKSQAARRRQYIERLRARLQTAPTPSALWRLAYTTGYRACWHSWMRRVRRGEVAILKERRRFGVEAA